MLKECLWLTVLHVAINFSVREINAADDREYVHIKVHMPDVLRKHYHHQKVLQHHAHHRPKSIKQYYQRPNKLSPPSSTTPTHHHHNHQYQQYVPEEFQFLPTPNLPIILTEPELEETEDFEPADLMSTFYKQQQGDTFPQLFGTAASPPIIQHPATTTSKTQIPQLKQQLMKQLFTPEMMSAAMAAATSTDSENFDGDTNALMPPPNDFLTDLQKEYVKKYVQQKIQPPPERLLMHEKFTKKKRKYPDVRQHYNQQQPQKEHQQQYYSQQYNHNYNQNHQNNYDDIRPASQQQQHHKLQQYYTQPNIDIESDEDMDNTAAAAFAQEDLDDNSSGEEYNGGGGGTSYSDMYAAFAQPTVMQPSTVPTGLQQQQQQWRQYHHKKQQQEQFVLPTMRFTSTPISLPLSSSTAASSAATTLRNSYEQAFIKKRKNRIKPPKRSRIHVQ